MLVHDWAPNDGEGDKLLFVFSCGELGDDADRITVDGRELDQWQWVEVGQLDEYVIPRLARRLTRAFQAYEEGVTLYLEHGEPVPDPDPRHGHPRSTGTY